MINQLQQGFHLIAKSVFWFFFVRFIAPFFSISPSRIPLICGYVSNLESFMSAFVLGFGTGHMFALFSFIPASILVFLHICPAVAKFFLMVF